MGRSGSAVVRAMISVVFLNDEIGQYCPGQ